MRIRSFCSIEELNDSDHFINQPNLLPLSFLKRKLVLEEPSPIRDREYFIFYDKKHEKLYLRYLAFDTSIHFDYWKKVNVGELIQYSDYHFRSKLANAKESKKLYFHVASPKEQYVRFYLLEPTEDNEQHFGEQIKMIFIPSDQFIKKCTDSDDVFQSLKKYFYEYTDYMNGEHFMIRTDTYDLKSANEYVNVSDSDWSGSVIGYQSAMKELREFELPDLEHNG